MKRLALLTAMLGRIAWNRKLQGKPARRGAYRIIVTATAGTGTASSALAVRL